MAATTLNRIVQKNHVAAGMQSHCKRINTLTELFSASLEPIGAQDLSHLCYCHLKMVASHCEFRTQNAVEVCYNIATNSSRLLDSDQIYM